MDKSRYFVIVNKENDKKYLLSFNYWKDNGTPKGYIRETKGLPLPQQFWNLPIYDFIKVYKMDDYEWWASKLDKDETNDFFNEEYGNDNDVDEVRECDLDNEGMWYSTDDPKDIEALGDSDEIISIEKVDGMTRRKTAFGDLMRRNGQVYKFMSFRDVLKMHGDFKEPFMIASTEW